MRNVALGAACSGGFFLLAMASCSSTDELTPPPVNTQLEAGFDAPVDGPLEAQGDGAIEAGPPATCSLDGWCHTALPAGDAGAPLSLRDVRVLGEEAWAVAESGQILRFSAGAWGLEHRAPVALRSVGGTSGSDLWAVGDAGVVLRRTVVGSTVSWVSTPSGTTANLQSVWAAAPGQLWVVGVEGALRSRGTPGTAGFSFVRTPIPPALTGGLTGLYRVWGTDPNNVWLVGPNPCLDTGAVCEYDLSRVIRYGTSPDGGAKWSGINVGIFPPTISGGSVTPDNSVVMVGNLFPDGCQVTGLVPADAGADAQVMWSKSGVCSRQRGVWMSSARLGWSVGEDGLAQEWDGAKWRAARLTVTNVPIARHLFAVSGTRSAAGTEAWIVGDGIALHRHLAP